MGALIRMEVLIGMGVLNGIGALVNKTRRGVLNGIGALINKTRRGGAYSKGGFYWKEYANSNHYGSCIGSFTCYASSFFYLSYF